MVWWVQRENPEAAYAVRQFYGSQRRYKGLTQTAIHDLGKQNQDDVKSGMAKLMAAQDANVPVVLSPGEQVALRPYLDWIAITSAEARAVPGTKVGAPDPNEPVWIPQMPLRKDITEFMQNSQTYLGRVLPEYLAFNRNYVTARGGTWNRETETEAKNHLKGLITQIITSRTTTGSNSEFNALRESARKFGLPPSMRETDIYRLMDRYGDRFAADLAKIKHIENDPIASHYFGIADGAVPHGDTARIMWQHINGSRSNDAAPSHEVIDEAQRLAGSGVMQALTGVRNIVEGVRTIAPDVTSLARLKMVGAGIVGARQDYEKAKHTALASGTLKTNTADLEWGNDEALRYNISRRMRTISDAAVKYSGLGKLEEISRAVMASIGEVMARDALANPHTPDNIRFLNKYGAGVDELTPEQMLNAIVGNYVTAKQSTYTAEGLPDFMARRGTTSQLLRLKRFGIENTARIYTEVVKPMRDGDYKPLLAYTLASVGVGQAKSFINQVLGKQDYKPTDQEIESMDQQDLERTLNIMEAIDDSSALGVIGNLMGTMAADVRGQDYSEINSVILSLGTDIIRLAVNTGEATAKGEPFDWAFKAGLDRIAKRYIQNYNLLDSLTSDKQLRGDIRDKVVFEGLKQNRVPVHALKAFIPFPTDLSGRNPSLHTLEEKAQRGSDAEAARAFELIQQAPKERNLKALVNNYPGVFQGKQAQAEFEAHLARAWGPEKVKELKQRQKEFEDQIARRAREHRVVLPR